MKRPAARAVVSSRALHDEMKKHWTEAQIMELGSFMVCAYGMAMFMRSLGAKAAAS